MPSTTFAQAEIRQALYAYCLGLETYAIECVTLVSNKFYEMKEFILAHSDPKKACHIMQQC